MARLLARRAPISAPGGGPVDANLAARDLLLERPERGPDAPPELVGPDGAHAALRVVEVIEIDGLQSQVAAAALDLFAQVAGRHAMNAIGQLGARDDSRLQIGLF